MKENAYYKLLKSWCDKLIEMQITELSDKNFYGGILCPACSLIHGRIGDAVYPFTFMYDATGDEKYLNSAKMVVDWSEYNVKRCDGGYFNDKTNSWKGISVFSAMSLGETLFYHGKCLDKETYDKWYGIFVRLSEFIYTYFDNPHFRPHINYYVTECPAMALAFLLTGEEKYKVKAYERAEYIRKHFTPEGLLCGEGPIDKLSPRGFHYVDLGYNVEESLPALAAFAHFMKDEEYLGFVGKVYKAHIEFMLPDGAWDNSWGTRANKWTYWGSRTSDGCQSGLCYLCGLDDVFAEAVERSFELYEKCTSDGLLYGGKMYIENGEDPCTHHTFCHAKSLCTMLETGFEHKKSTVLPRERLYGVKNFDSFGVSLISKSNWRATVNFADTVLYDGSAATGGTMTLLWHNKIGVIFAATMAKFGMSEPKNMQLSRVDDDMPCGSLRISDGEYVSVNEKNAQVKITQGTDINIDVSGRLCDNNFNEGKEYKMGYCFSEDALEITAMSVGSLVLPVVCSKNDTITLSDKKIVIERNSAKISLETNGTFLSERDTKKRSFNVVGGFCTYPVSVKLNSDTPIMVKLCVE